MEVLVTGANGFIGSHLCRALIAKGYRVRALVRPGSDLRSLVGLELTYCYGDILQPDSLAQAAAGCSLLFHVAGVFAYSGVKGEQLISEARSGAAHVVQAAVLAGVKRMVLTSSSVTFGATNKRLVIDEAHPGGFQDASDYVTSKRIQEETAFQLAAQTGLDLVSVHPTLTVGGPDYGLTESNHAIVGYLNDPYKTTWIGGCNIVSVKDIAEGHILVAEKGLRGERYLLGAENLDWSEVHRNISELCGLPGPYLTANHTAAYLAAAFHEALALISRQRPPSTREQARMAGNYYWYDHSKAATLGYAPVTAREALASALEWLITSDHVSASLRSAMQLHEDVYKMRRK